MARARTRYCCTECGGSAGKWAGRCGQCGAWNTLVEEVEPEVVGTVSSRPAGVPLPIVDVEADGATALPTGIEEVDRVLGGGLVPGSVTLLGGEPGVGKSTLLAQVLLDLCWSGVKALYVSAEESAPQVRARAERLGALSPDLWLLAETGVERLIAAADAVDPAVLVVDSIQMVAVAELSSAPGSVAQVREAAHRLTEYGKTRGIAVILVGHVTKDGGLAGPRVLEHMVDTVLEFGGDRHHALRMLRATKHRFGATSEVGVFDMRAGGLRGVPDPSALFLADRARDVPGSVVVPTLQGRRPMLVEIQALVSPGIPGMTRRNAEGLDRGRLDLLLAVLGRRASVSFAEHDVYALAVGGVRIDDPGADLAVALAAASARSEVALAQDLVAMGEIGLTGEVRQVAQLEQRLSEAARLGFRRALVPAGAPEPPVGIELVRVATVREALAAAQLTPTS